MLQRVTCLESFTSELHYNISLATNEEEKKKKNKKTGTTGEGWAKTTVTVNAEVT